VAIRLTAESGRAPAPLSDGDPLLIVELRETEYSAVAGGMVAVGGDRKGKRDEYRCAGCGYGIVVYGPTRSCPMCGETRWEHVAWRPFSQLLDSPFAELGRWDGPRLSRPGQGVPIASGQ
jgi:hypothetical protein